MKILSFGGSDRRTQQADAVVTGAGSGIGRAFASELSRRGGRVVCADIDPIRAKETVTLITEAGGRAVDFCCDVSNEQQVLELADASERWLGNAVGLVINNAGIGVGGNLIGETAMRDWRRTLDVNLLGRNSWMRGIRAALARAR